MIRDTLSGSVIAHRKAATTLIIRHAMEGFNPLILGLLWLLSACATAQPGVVHEIDLEQLTMQATTLDEAEAWLGPPLRREGMETGAVMID